MAKSKKSSKSSETKATASTKAAAKTRAKARQSTAREPSLHIPPGLHIPKAASVAAFAAPAPAAEPLTVRQGARPAANTVLFVHGIGNKPMPSILKCQWDSALFGLEMGDRTRLAYWVDRERYPTPELSSCAAPDDTAFEEIDLAPESTVMARSASAASDEAETVRREIEALTDDPARRAWLQRLADRAIDGAEQAAAEAPRPGVGVKVLPLPAFIRRRLSWLTTRLFLRDVNDFLFEPERRQPMLDSVLERLRSGGGPFVVVAHSQGTMIAYEVLRRLSRDEITVPLFVTLGSPLGLAEVQDVFRVWTGVKRGKLPFPPCVDRWVNVADRLDPVALDSRLNNDFAGKIEDHSGWSMNHHSPRSPHSASGYLVNAEVQKAVRQTLSNAFSHAIGGGIITKDLISLMEDGVKDERHQVLIQIGGAGLPASAGADDRAEAASPAGSGAAIGAAIEALVAESGGAPADARIEPLKRFVAAELTRREIETLRSRHGDLQIRRLWRNAPKRAFMNVSTHTVQARPAQLGYDAMGRGIRWAVLDTGIRADHPHFKAFANVKRQWDCTVRGAPRELGPGEKDFEQLDKQGHGTHVAGVIGGRLEAVDAAGKHYDMCAMAPEVELLGFKVLDDRGFGNDAWIIKALDQIALLNEGSSELVVHGVNLSLGGNFDPSIYGCGHTPLCQELRRLWRQGVIVCLAAGNEGWAELQTAQGLVPANMDLSIGDPANLEEAISVGSVHKERPHTFGISFFSSRGPTADGRRKPDVVAPGEAILSANHDWANRNRQGGGGGGGGGNQLDQLYIELSGTSMATPHVSGMLAAFLSVRKEFSGYPDRVKAIMLDACTDLGRDPYMQGAGLPNLIQMLANT